MDRAEGFVIAGEARQVWEGYLVPHRIEVVVDALFALPDEDVNERLVETHGGKRAWVAHGNVVGSLFMIRGYKDRVGRWTGVDVVVPVWPPGR